MAQDTKMMPYCYIVYAQSSIVSKWMRRMKYCGLFILIDYLIPARRTDLRKGILPFQRGNMRESEITDRYLDHTWEQRHLWNMSVISIVRLTLGTILNDLERCLEELETGRRIETIQITALLRLARILRRILETGRDLFLLSLQYKTISNRWCENLAKNFVHMNLAFLSKANNSHTIIFHISWWF